jgi:carboxyl-terminal processing protease
MSAHRWKGPRRAAAVLAAAAALGLAPAPAAAQETLAPGLALATFDSAWSVIHRTHFDSTFNGVDWGAVRTELRPRAQAARTPAELRGVLQEMVGRLRQSHFYVIPADVKSGLEAEEAGAGAGGAPGDAGMELRLVDGRFLVTRVAPGGAAEAAGVRTGWTVEAVGDREAGQVLEALRALEGRADPRAVELTGYGRMTAALGGPAGEPVRVRFLDGAGRPVSRDVVRRASTALRTRFGGLPEMPVTLERERLRMPDGTTVGVIRFDLWMPAISRDFDAAVDELRDADGIVLDLRGNPGGVGAMAMGIAGHFMDEARSLGAMRTRDTELRFVVNPRRVDTHGRTVAPYAGPVAILTDALSMSTTEIFAAGMQQAGRARVFGGTTAGQALPSYPRPLPSGDVLVHAFASFAMPDGAPVEGRGVVPDVAAPPTRAELLAGRDPALEAAKRWISETRRRGASR